MAILLFDHESNTFVLKTLPQENKVAQLYGVYDVNKNVWLLSHEAVPEIMKHLPVVVTDTASAIIEPKKPLKYVQELMFHQVNGVQFLLRKKRAILAFDMGLGKTATAIRAVAEIASEFTTTVSVLVVTKKSLIANWHAEINRWYPPEAPLVNWVVTNYEQIVIHPENYKHHYDVLIVDESQAIRNRNTKRSRAVRQLARSMQYVWLLSGTPIVNTPDDVWAQLNCVAPKEFNSYWRFVEHYLETEFNGFAKRVVGVRNERRFAEMLAVHMLRYDKEILQLPPLSQEMVYVELTQRQKQLYKELRENMVALVSSGDAIVTPNSMTLLLRLRQIMCTPALVGDVNESAKTTALLELLEDVTPRHKVIVFSAFAEYVKLLHRELENRYGAVKIIGEMSVEERMKAVDRFKHDASCKVLVGTIGAMGEGLNLQEASVVVFTDIDWTPAANEQAISRAYRKGQTNSVHVVYLVAKGTVDSVIHKLVSSKQDKITVVEQAIKAIVGGDVC